MKLDNEKIIQYLPIGKCIHKTRNENCFLISHYLNEKIFFSIPKNHDKSKPHKKSISIQLVIQIFESENYDFKDFTYSDCRKSATRGIINIIKSK
jgi:hypothetical protein